MRPRSLAASAPSRPRLRCCWVGGVEGSEDPGRGSEPPSAHANEPAPFQLFSKLNTADPLPLGGCATGRPDIGECGRTGVGIGGWGQTDRQPGRKFELRTRRRSSTASSLPLPARQPPPLRGQRGRRGRRGRRRRGGDTRGLLPPLPLTPVPEPEPTRPLHPCPAQTRPRSRKSLRMNGTTLCSCVRAANRRRNVDCTRAAPLSDLLTRTCGDGHPEPATPREQWAPGACPFHLSTPACAPFSLSRWILRPSYRGPGYKLPRAFPKRE
jgi:hypothetical protein